MYVFFLTLFHFMEFFVTSLYQPSTLSYDCEFLLLFATPKLTPLHSLDRESQQELYDCSPLKLDRVLAGVFDLREEQVLFPQRNSHWASFRYRRPGISCRNKWLFYFYIRSTVDVPIPSDVSVRRKFLPPDRGREEIVAQARDRGYLQVIHSLSHVSLEDLNDRYGY